MFRSTTEISINGRALGWASSRTSRRANNSYRTSAGSLSTWPRLVSRRKPFATTWTISGVLAARSSATCTTTRRSESFLLSGFSGSPSTSSVALPSTMAQMISSVPSTPLAASCIASLNPDPQIPRTNLNDNCPCVGDEFASSEDTHHLFAYGDADPGNRIDSSGYNSGEGALQLAADTAAVGRTFATTVVATSYGSSAASTFLTRVVLTGAGAGIVCVFDLYLSAQDEAAVERGDYDSRRIPPGLCSVRRPDIVDSKRKNDKGTNYVFEDIKRNYKKDKWCEALEDMLEDLKRRRTASRNRDEVRELTQEIQDVIQAMKFSL